VDLTRNGIYGYDISTELLGTQGTLRIGYLRETPLTVLTRTGVSHDTVPYFMQRFGDAYTAQLENFARNVLDGKEPPVTIEDGLHALRVAVAATQARETGLAVSIASPSSENRNPAEPRTQKNPNQNLNPGEPEPRT
jgi:predicted dehydrogenase